MSLEQGRGVDHYQRALLNSFTFSRLDRNAVRRGDSAWLARCASDPGSRFVVMRGERFLLGPDHHPALLDGAAARRLLSGTGGGGSPVFLGCLDDVAFFVYDLGAAASDSGSGAEAGAAWPGHFAGLRETALKMDPEYASMLAYAQAMVLWRRRHRLCPGCGAVLEDHCGGHLLRCANGGCSIMQFPRTDPAVIVLVENRGACLLGRQAGWPALRYSVLAGFVEPGESAEQAVVREVDEETGVAVDNIYYHGSQPWPFPGSLMLGYYARGRGRKIVLNDNELEDARWFTRRQMRRACENGELLLSPGLSISYRLIEHWYDAAGDRPLSRVLGREE